MQLRLALVVLVASLWSGGAAHAASELILRGVYYKERATRVIPPMIDGRLDIGDNGTATAHLVVDAISSASVGTFEE
jgi:hypothetical protein